MQQNEMGGEGRFFLAINLYENNSVFRLKVTVKKLLQSSEASIIFDAVFICNGHNFLPNIPTFIGLTQFEGNKIHSHDYRRPGVFKGIVEQ